MKRSLQQQHGGLPVQTSLKAGERQYVTSGNLFCANGNSNCVLYRYDNQGKLRPIADCRDGSVTFVNER